MSAPIHLTLDQLKLGDLTFGLSVRPWIRQRHGSSTKRARGHGLGLDGSTTDHMWTWLVIWM